MEIGMIENSSIPPYILYSYEWIIYFNTDNDNSYFSLLNLHNYIITYII